MFIWCCSVRCDFVVMFYILCYIRFTGVVLSNMILIDGTVPFKFYFRLCLVLFQLSMGIVFYYLLVSFCLFVTFLYNWYFFKMHYSFFLFEIWIHVVFLQSNIWCSICDILFILTVIQFTVSFLASYILQMYSFSVQIVNCGTYEQMFKQWWSTKYVIINKMNNHILLSEHKEKRPHHLT